MPGSAARLALLAVCWVSQDSVLPQGGDSESASLRDQALFRHGFWSNFKLLVKYAFLLMDELDDEAASEWLTSSAWISSSEAA